MSSGPIHSFEFLLDKLLVRRKENLTTLHFVESAEGFSCPDLNVRATTYEELKFTCKSVYDSLNIGDLLPAAPESEWRRMWGKTSMSQRRVTRDIKNPKSGQYIAIALIQI